MQGEEHLGGERQQQLVARVHALSERHPRYGYRRIAAIPAGCVFQQREAREEFATVRSSEELRSRILASYDFRSKLLHTGDRTGIGLLARSHMLGEFVLGKPCHPDEELVELLSRSLTLDGLERVVAAVLRNAIDRHLLAPNVQ